MEKNREKFIGKWVGKKHNRRESTFFNEIKTTDEHESVENKTKKNVIWNMCRFCCFQHETTIVYMERILTCKNRFQDNSSSSFEWHLIGNRIVRLLLFQCNPSNLFYPKMEFLLMEKIYQRQIISRRRTSTRQSLNHFQN